MLVVLYFFLNWVSLSLQTDLPVSFSVHELAASE